MRPSRASSRRSSTSTLSGLADAVLRCWRSRLTDRVKAYGGERESGSMAVLIQPMIAADAAGVAFTIDPVSARHRTIIEAVEGLGDRLVSGAATPERWTVEDDGSIEASIGGDGPGRRAGPGDRRSRAEGRGPYRGAPRTSSGRSPAARSGSSRPGRSRPCRALDLSSSRSRSRCRRATGREMPSTSPFPSRRLDGSS